MPVDAEDLQVLTRIGLTRAQANLYLTLLSVGKEDAKVLSQQTRTPRTETYRILDELEDIGLVEKQLSAPYVYEAAPIQFGTQVLITKQLEEYNQNRKELERLVEKFDKIKETPQEIEPKITINKGKHKLLQVLTSGQERAQFNVDFISTTKRWMQIIDYCYDNWEESLNRGVHYRGILEELESEINFPENARSLLGKPNLTLKIVKNTFGENYAIFDSKEAAFNFSPAKSLADSTTIWTNHPSLVAILKEHFETLWKTAANRTN